MPVMVRSLFNSDFVTANFLRNRSILKMSPTLYRLVEGKTGNLKISCIYFKFSLYSGLILENILTCEIYNLRKMDISTWKVRHIK